MTLRDFFLFITRWAISPIAVNAYYDMLANKMGECHKNFILINYVFIHKFTMNNCDYN